MRGVGEGVVIGRGGCSVFVSPSLSKETREPRESPRQYNSKMVVVGLPAVRVPLSFLSLGPGRRSAYRARPPTPLTGYYCTPGATATDS